MKNSAEVLREGFPEEDDAREADKKAHAGRIAEVFDILTRQRLTPEEIGRRVGEEDAESVKERAYEQYRSLGGIINKNDYRSVLERARGATISNRASISQAEGYAEKAGITLDDSEGAIDPRTILYAILRADTKPAEVQYHHAQMSDQRLFAEALRILGDDDSLKKLIEAYPNISF